MANGGSGWGSRKFVIAGASFIAVTVMAAFGTFSLAKTALDIATIIGAWGVIDGAILKLYNDANIKANGRI